MVSNHLVSALHLAADRLLRPRTMDRRCLSYSKNLCRMRQIQRRTPGTYMAGGRLHNPQNLHPLRHYGRRTSGSRLAASHLSDTAVVPPLRSHNRLCHRSLLHPRRRQQFSRMHLLQHAPMSHPRRPLLDSCQLHRTGNLLLLPGNQRNRCRTAQLDYAHHGEPVYLRGLRKARRRTHSD